MISKYQWPPHWAVSMNKVLDWLTGRIPTDIYVALVEKAHRGDFDIEPTQCGVDGKLDILTLLDAKIKECEDKAQHPSLLYYSFGKIKKGYTPFRTPEQVGLL